LRDHLWPNTASRIVPRNLNHFNIKRLKALVDRGDAPHVSRRNGRFAARCMCAAQRGGSNRCRERIRARIDLNDEGLHPGLSRHLFDLRYSTVLPALLSNPAIRNEQAFSVMCI
jgi:hypothetical protein